MTSISRLGRSINNVAITFLFVFVGSFSMWIRQHMVHVPISRFQSEVQFMIIRSVKDGRSHPITSRSYHMLQADQQQKVSVISFLPWFGRSGLLMTHETFAWICLLSPFGWFVTFSATWSAVWFATKLAAWPVITF